VPEISSSPTTRDEVEVEMTVNGRSRRVRVEPRKTLSDTLRDDLRLTGTHVGCEHGVCGACTVLVDGEAVRSCLMFAVQADGAEVTTVEGLAPDAHTLSPVQRAFQQCHGLQCGFCTPGFVVTATAFLAKNPAPDEDEIRVGLSGNLCRCTGYQGIVRAVKMAADEMAADEMVSAEHAAGHSSNGKGSA
jgi:carbon-monoxide dehydrogenase small subunit